MMFRGRGAIPSAYFTSRYLDWKTTLEFWTVVLLTILFTRFDVLLMKHHRHQAVCAFLHPQIRFRMIPSKPNKHSTSIHSSCHHHLSDGEPFLNSPRLFLRFTSSSVLPVSADHPSLLEESRKMSKASNPNRSLTSGQSRSYILIRT
jgi:hypothetical protein